MDGNLRWAKKNNLIAKDGYLKGLNKINEVIDLCIREKIKYLTLYSTSYLCLHLLIIVHTILILL